MKGMTEETQEMLIGVILTVMILGGLLLMFGVSTDCDVLAINTTLNDLKAGIDQVARPDFPQYAGFGEPSPTESSYYVVKPVRLCQRPDYMRGGVPIPILGGEFPQPSDIPVIGSYFANLNAHVPEYVINFENWEESFPVLGWDESYPWSGGAGAAFLFYSGIRYGPVVARNAFRVGGFTYDKTTSLIMKWARRSPRVEKTFKAFSSYMRLVFGLDKETLINVNGRILSLRLTMKEKFFRAISKRYIGSGILKSLPRTVKVDLANAAMLASRGNLDEAFEIYSKYGIVKRVDRATGKWIISKEPLKINPSFRAHRIFKQSRRMIGAFDSARAAVFDELYIIPRISDRIKAWFSKKTTNVVHGSKLYRTMVVDDVTKLRKAWRWLNGAGYDTANILTRDELIALQTALRRQCLQNPDSCRPYFEKWFKGAKFNDKQMFRVLKDDLTWLETGQYLAVIKKGSSNTIYNSAIDELINTPSEVILTRESFRSRMLNVFDRRIRRGEITQAQVVETAERVWDASDPHRALIQRGSETAIQRFKMDAYAAYWKAGPQTELEEVFLGLMRKETPYVYGNPGLAKTYGTRIVFLDLGKYGGFLNPLGGGYTASLAEQKVFETTNSNLDEIQGGCADNYLCISPQSGETKGVRMSDDVQNYDVRLWRPLPASHEKVPIGINTLIFRYSIRENPKFYLAGPCFGFAKIWKQGNNIYVDVEKGNVGGNANYCFADYDLLWGRAGDNPEPLYYAGVFSGATVGCYVLTGWWSGGASSPLCIRAAALSTVAIIEGDVLRETSKSADASDRWGYWNFYKLADTCDWISIVSSFGGTRAFSKALQQPIKFRGVGGAGGFLKTNAPGFIARSHRYALDLCAFVYFQGESYLAWPNVGNKKGALNESIMKQYAPELATGISR